jgi:phosphoglycolate phosphatase
MNFEIVNPCLEPSHIRHALFDFDGTISLIREGWQGIMVPMMVESLLETPEHESREELFASVTDFIGKLTGKQSIYQMIRLCEEIRRRGGKPLSPLEYKRIYHDRLWAHIKGRVADLRSGKIQPEEMMVPGVATMLETLRNRGVTCHLASGTDEVHVRDEVSALQLSQYFHDIHGAVDDYRSYSKKMVIERILDKNHLKGFEFITFGDGYVEIEDTKSVGGIAVGVASDEARRKGINEWKRRRLIEAGADLIIPDFHEHDHLISYLFVED